VSARAGMDKLNGDSEHFFTSAGGNRRAVRIEG
jgi:hypothetical protein